MGSLIIKSMTPAPAENTEASVSPLRIVKLLLLVVALVTAMVTGFLGWQKWQRLKQDAHFREYVANVDTLFSALQQYKEKTGAYPAGSNSDVARALSGRNDRNLIIVIPTKMAVNGKGEFVDPWGSALRLYYTTPGVLIRSAGPNKVFEDARTPQSDDIYLSN